MSPERDWARLVGQGCCDECGLDATAAPRDALAPHLEAAARSWAAVLTGTPTGVLRGRPAHGWSALEYAGHVAGVLAVFDVRVGRMLADDAPELGWWDHEAAAVRERYQEADPDAVAASLTAAAAQLSERLRRLDGAGWSRTGVRRGTEHFTVEGLARFAWHEAVHHRHDATRRITADWARRPLDADAAAALLRTGPVVPADVAAFSSNVLAGQPGIYPDGPPMSPAPGPPLDEDGAGRMLDGLMGDGVDTARARMEDADLRARVPDPGLRAALLLLGDGPAAPELDAFLRGETAVLELGVGDSSDPGRVIGPDPGHPGPHRRVLSGRYRAEHPAVVAPSLAHALCHHGERASNAEEATLHGLLAAVHTRLLAVEPGLGTLRSELARRQASLTITLLNARPPGRVTASIRCPDGPGTIPGGNPSLQCPDLWGIPFTSRAPTDCDLTIPEAVRSSLQLLAAQDAPAPPTTYGDELGEWQRGQLGHGRWFGPQARARAGLALGLFGGDPFGERPAAAGGQSA